jgi:hypothetical protein
MVKKLVTSASALIGRRPTEVSRSCSHFGLGPLRTDRMVRPMIQGHASGHSIRQRGPPSKAAGMRAGCHGFSVPTPAAARSRAMPRTLKQSPRFGVTPISMIGSSSPAQAA